MKLLHSLQAVIVVVGVVALVATAPGCGNERRGRTVVVRDYHDGGRHRNRKVVFDGDRRRHRDLDGDKHRHRDKHHHRH
jgi:hypothetical protein